MSSILKIQNLPQVKRYFPVVLIGTVSLSWTLYPWAISWILPNAIRIIFALALLLLAFWTFWANVHFSRINLKPASLKTSFLLYAGYSVILIVGAFCFHEHADLRWIPRYLLKLIFFIYLLKVLSFKTIDCLFDIFSNSTVVLTVVSLIGVLGIYLNWFNLSEIVTTQGLDYKTSIAFLWSGFDGNARIFSRNPTLLRLQSFAIEPAAYALAASVAIFWLIFMRKSFYRALIIACGLAASCSLGIMLGVGIVLILVFFNKKAVKFAKIKLFITLLLFFSFGQLVGNINYQYLIDQKSIGALNERIGDATKTDSLRQRFVETQKVFHFLQEHPEGAGIGGAKKLLNNPISVGYVNAMADVGVIGGILYIGAYVILAWFATAVILGLKNYSDMDTIDIQRSIAVGAAVLICLFSGWQREQPDSSYWHFWIIASFIYILTATKNMSKNIETVS